jgi:hypothetical protein
MSAAGWRFEGKIISLEFKKKAVLPDKNPKEETSGEKKD